MYQINYEDDIITYKDIDDALADLNKYLSKQNDHIEINSDDNSQITFNIDHDNQIIFKHDYDFTNKHIFIPYFIFTNESLSKISLETIEDIQLLKPGLLLDILTYDQALLNPYFVLTNIFKVPEEAIYQAFILYLNKTIMMEDDPIKVNFNKIFSEFFSSDNNKDIPLYKYQKLLTFYLSAKKILPFMVKFEQYHSNFNTLS